MKQCFVFLFCVLLLSAPTVLRAQESLVLSVTPPLFQVSAVPGQAWESQIKIINTNAYDITVYATPVNFEPLGEAGQGRFVPIIAGETAGQTLAEWIRVTSDPVVVPKEQSIEIPFSVAVPNDAPPGGHFAAVLIGTRPPDATNQTSMVRTAQLVTSLVFLRVAGDVIEAGAIREFSTSKYITDTPQAEFSLRFQNDGNVHLQPRGDIRIYNMWGKERGVIPINQTSSFGNVLPNSIRNFQFSWEGERNFTDLGRYTAVASLAYGTDGIKSASQELHFWIIPIKGLLVAVGIVITLLLLIKWAIGAYIKRILRQAGIEAEHGYLHQAGDVAMPKRARVKMQKTSVVPERTTNTWPVLGLIRQYRLFIFGIPSVMLLIGLLLWYFAGALATERAYEVTIQEGEQVVKTNSEEQYRSTSDTATTASEQPFILKIVNVSSEPGGAAALADNLESHGYQVASVEPDLNRESRTTVIVADPALADITEQLSKEIGGALISLVASSDIVDAQPVITIFVGNDYITR